MRRFLLLFSCLPLLAACKQSDGEKMILDQYGFAHTADASVPAQILNIGIGETAGELVTSNPYLSNVVPQTISPGDQLRLAIETTVQVRYRDSDLEWDFCAKSVNADGNDTNRNRVAYIGAQLCDPPTNDYQAAFSLAKQLMQQLEKRNPTVENLRSFYLTATHERLVAIGGELWANVERKRGLADSYEKLLPVEEEESRFKAALANPQLDDDGRPVNMRAMVGVYASRRAIIEIGVSSQAYYGGNNLSQEQRMARRYSVGLNIRLRSDIDSSAAGR